MRVAGEQQPRASLAGGIAAALSPARREEQRKRREELVAQAAVYEQLVAHPGWALFRAEVEAAIGAGLGTMLNAYPAPTKETPNGDMRAAQIDWVLGEVNMAKHLLRIPGRVIRQAARLRGPQKTTEAKSDE